MKHMARNFHTSMTLLFQPWHFGLKKRRTGGGELDQQGLGRYGVGEAYIAGADNGDVHVVSL